MRADGTLGRCIHRRCGVSDQRRHEDRQYIDADLRAGHDKEVLASGRAGSLLVFNGSVWHGHTANTSSGPRRSLQGAFIPRGGRASTDFAARIARETRARLGPVAQYVLSL